MTLTLLIIDGNSPNMAHLSTVRQGNHFGSVLFLWHHKGPNYPVACFSAHLFKNGAKKKRLFSFHCWKTAKIRLVNLYFIRVVKASWLDPTGMRGDKLSSYFISFVLQQTCVLTAVVFFFPHGTLLETKINRSNSSDTPVSMTKGYLYFSAAQVAPLQHQLGIYSMCELELQLLIIFCTLDFLDSIYYCYLHMPKKKKCMYVSIRVLTVYS